MISLSSLDFTGFLKSSVLFLCRRHFVLYVFSYCCCLLCCSLVTECSLLPARIVDKDCSEYRTLIYTSSGKIHSPNFPNSYSRNKSCEWRIRANRYEHILLSFPVFQVDGGRSCRGDHVELHDITSETSIDIFVGNFCREHLPPAHFITTGNEARIILHSDKHSDPDFGVTKFQIIYSKPTCGENLTALQGSFKSPNFPNPYPSDKVCTWLITVPKDLIITLHFLTFSLEPMPSCAKDYVEVLDGNSKDSQQIGRFCSSESPPPIIRSTGNELRITFKSFASTSKVGFHAVYKTVPHCGGVLREDSASFTSPGFGMDDRELAAHKFCSWVMSVDKDSIVSLTFRAFDIPSAGNTSQCLSNYVDVYDGVMSNSKLIGRYCNNAKPHNNIVRASGHVMMLQYRTDHSFINGGFYATYITIDPHDLYDKCTQIGKTHNLLFPCQNGIYIDCEWRCDGTDDCDDGSDELYCDCGDGSNEFYCDNKKKNKINAAEPYVITILATMVTAVLLCVTVFVIERIWRKRRRRSRRSRRRAQRASQYSSTMDYLSPPPPYSAELDGEETLSFESTFPVTLTCAPEETSEQEGAATVPLPESAQCTSTSQNSESNSRTEPTLSDVNYLGDSSVNNGTGCDTEIHGDGDSVSISSNENQPLIV